MKPVALPPGRARLSTKPAPTGSATTANTIGTVRVACSNGATVAVPCGQDDVRRERDQFRRVFANVGRHWLGPSGCRSARCGRRSSPIAPAPAGTPRRGPDFRIVRGCGHEHADAPHPLGLLRARGERPRSRRAAEKRDELAPSHVVPQGQSHASCTAQTGWHTGRPNVRFGSKADICTAKVMSALPPKADMCSALADVR